MVVEEEWRTAVTSSLQWMRCITKHELWVGVHGQWRYYCRFKMYVSISMNEGSIIEPLSYKKTIIKKSAIFKKTQKNKKNKINTQVAKKTLFQAFCLDRNVLSRQLNSPALRCPTTSARLPFLTLVMKAPNLPDSVILPPTTCSDRQSNLSNTRGPYTRDTSQAPPC